MNREQEIECFARMLGLDGFDKVDGAPYVTLDPYDRETRDMLWAFDLPEGWEERPIKPRVAILENGIFSPVTAPWKGWAVVGHYPLGEHDCDACTYDNDGNPRAPQPDCVYCEGDGLWYFGEETIVACLVPVDTYHDVIVSAFSHMGLSQAYASACDSWTEDTDGEGYQPPTPGAGGNWCDYAPELDEEGSETLREWTENAIHEIEDKWGMTLSQWLESTEIECDDRCITRFAECLSLQYVGHGVGLTDWAHDYSFQGDCPDLPYGDDSDVNGVCLEWIETQSAEWGSDE